MLVMLALVYFDCAEQVGSLDVLLLSRQENLEVVAYLDVTANLVKVQ